MVRHFFLVAVALSSFGCGPVESTNGPQGGGGSDSTFTPFASSFTGYHGWKAFHLEHGTQADGVHDVDAPLTAYLNKVPPKGATEFPVGTIIVKEVEQGAIDKRQVFAAVKRGGDYNPDGAVNWEWFELNRNVGDGDTVRIVWGAAVPPKGEPYLDNVKGDCNGCHLGAKPNDYIWSAPLSLQVLAK
jgi:hypothetical protein